MAQGEEREGVAATEKRRVIDEGAIALFLLDQIDYILPIFVVPRGLVFQATNEDILID